MVLLGLLPCLLLCPNMRPVSIAWKALVNIHQKDDSDLRGRGETVDNLWQGTPLLQEPSLFTNKLLMLSKCRLLA